MNPQPTTTTTTAGTSADPTQVTTTAPTNPTATGPPTVSNTSSVFHTLPPTTAFPGTQPVPTGVNPVTSANVQATVQQPTVNLAQQAPVPTPPQLYTPQQVSASLQQTTSAAQPVSSTLQQPTAYQYQHQGTSSQTNHLDIQDLRDQIAQTDSDLQRLHLTIQEDQRRKAQLAASQSNTIPYAQSQPQFSVQYGQPPPHSATPSQPAFGFFDSHHCDPQASAAWRYYGFRDVNSVVQDDDLAFGGDDIAPWQPYTHYSRAPRQHNHSDSTYRPGSLGTIQRMPSAYAPPQQFISGPAPQQHGSLYPTLSYGQNYGPSQAPLQFANAPQYPQYGAYGPPNLPVSQAYNQGAPQSGVQLNPPMPNPIGGQQPAPVQPAAPLQQPPAMPAAAPQPIQQQPAAPAPANLNPIVVQQPQQPQGQPQPQPQQQQGNLVPPVAMGQPNIGNQQLGNLQPQPPHQQPNYPMMPLPHQYMQPPPFMQQAAYHGPPLRQTAFQSSQSHGRNRASKAIDDVPIPTFHGNRNDFKPWLATMNNLLHLKAYPRNEWARITRAYLRGRAQDYVNDHDPNHGWQYEDLIEELKREYQFQSAAIALSNYQSIYQYDNETVSNYFERLERAYADAHPNRPIHDPDRNIDLCSKGIDGLREDIRSRLSEPLSIVRFQDLKERAKGMEAYIGRYERGRRVRATAPSEDTNIPAPSTEPGNTQAAPVNNRPQQNQNNRSRSIMKKNVSFLQPINVNLLNEDDRVEILKTAAHEANVKATNLELVLQQVAEDVYKMAGGKFAPPPQVPRQNPTRTRSRSEDKCYHCGESGHYRADCKLRLNRYGDDPQDQSTQAQSAPYNRAITYYPSPPLGQNTIPPNDPHGEPPPTNTPRPTRFRIPQFEPHVPAICITSDRRTDSRSQSADSESSTVQSL